MAVGGLLLAAGGGRRYGRPKALVVDHGVAWVDKAVTNLTAGGCASVTVVLGARAGEVRARLAHDARVVDNPAWAHGLATSLRAGLAALSTDPAPVAALVVLVDTPGLTPAAVRRIAALATADALVVATYGGRPGHPVLLGRAHWPGIAASAHGDRGARDYLHRHAASVRHIPCDDVADGTDVDTPP